MAVENWETPTLTQQELSPIREEDLATSRSRSRRTLSLRDSCVAPFVFAMDCTVAIQATEAASDLLEVITRSSRIDPFDSSGAVSFE